MKLIETDIGVTEHLIITLEDGIVQRILGSILHSDLMNIQVILCVFRITGKTVYGANKLNMYAKEYNGVIRLEVH